MPSNLTTGQVLPGFFGYVDYNTQGGGQAPTRRALLWGFITSSAQRTPNQPFLPASQQEADDGAGRGSDLANAYAAAVAQPDAQGADVWCVPVVAPSGGTAATYTLKVFVPGTNPTKSGTIQLWINSVQLPAVGFTISDTATTIGDAIAAAITSNLDLPLASAVNSGGVVTLTYIHKGTTGEDLPVRCNISPSASGVVLSPGQLTFSGTAGADGSLKVTFGALSVSTAITSGDTAPVIAGKVVASFNADTYPLYAQIDAGSSSKVDLLFTNDKDVRRISAGLITTTTTTVDAGSGAQSQPTLSYNGTQGVGAPSISAALTNLLSLGVFRSWAAPWLDATTVGAMATQIENQSDGSISGQKQQTLTLADSRASSVAGALPTSTSPNLTTSAPHYALCWSPDAPIQNMAVAARAAVAGALPTSTSPNLTTSAPHYALCWSPDAPIQNMAVAARAAVARVAKWLDTPQFNWNGFQLKGSARAPILLAASTPTELAQNAALRTYALAPIVNGSSGFLEVVKGRTTSLANDKKLWAWSVEAQAAYHAVDLALFFRSRFQGGSLVQFSEPKTADIFDANSFKSATQERMRFWENNGNYDGADALKDAVKSKINVNNPFRVDVEYPESPVLDLDQVVFTGRFAQPAA